jgi:putative transposase
MAAGSCLYSDDESRSFSHDPARGDLLEQNAANGVALLCAIFNYSYRRTGTLWEGRYKASLIDSDAYLLTFMRYIELNPVRAGMVSHPSEYPWSSYHFNALGQSNDLVTPYLEYLNLGKTAEARQAAYRQLFKYHITERSVAEMRNATNKAGVLGNDRFKQCIQRQTERRIEPSPKGGDRKSEQFRINRN